MASGGIYANPAETRDISALSLDELLKTKVKIATKSEESILHSPSTVALFTRESIQRLQIRTLAELLAKIPGFYSMYNSVEGNESHLVMRGHAQKYSSTLLLLLNGQRLNDDYTGGINYLLRYYQLKQVARVEVIRGPGSALYGSNAYSGVVNIITDFQPAAEATLGSFGSKEFAVSNRHNFAPWTFGWSVAAYQDSGDYFKPVFDRNGLQDATTDPKKQWQVAIRVSNESNEFDFTIQQSSRQNYYLYRRLRDGVTDIDLSGFYFNSKHYLLANDNWTITGNLGYQRAEREAITALTAQGTPPFIEADYLNGELFVYSSFNTGVDFSYFESLNYQLNFGFSYTESKVPKAFLKSNYDIFGNLDYLGEVRLFDLDSQRVVLDKTRTITSAYLQTQSRLNDKLRLTAGVRYDAYNDIDNSLMPRASLVYDYNKRNIFKFIYAQAYRAPSLGDLYDEESGLTIGNANLKASELESFELVHIIKGEKFLVSNTLFNQHHKNLIGFAQNSEGNVALANVASNKANGWEIEWKWKPLESIAVSSSYAHMMYNKTDLGSAMDLPKSEEIAPKSIFKTSLEYALEKWTFNVNASWRSKVQVLSKKNDLWLLDAQLVNEISSNQKLKFGIKNLLNENYTTSSYVVLGTDNNGNTVQEFPARGRSIGLSYILNF